ncbi:DUF3552 domain-containing protein [Candidatus Peregrinibacteria bacterium]|jgi:ribonucrease Y|nr:DUF3552 domain-containing protein [Candidatus Peregrinibacteria bacterium]MBT4055539.1 DUF3552 domain-containing protein [Candidatus Peregrinibacteria bacterium]
MNIVMNIIVALVVFSAGAGAGYLFFYKSKLLDIEKRRERAEKTLQEAKEEAQEIKESSKKQFEIQKERTEEGFKINERMISQMENSVKNKEQSVQKQEDKLNSLKRSVKGIEGEISSKEAGIKDKEKEFVEKLAEKSGKNPEATKIETIDRYQKELKEENTERLAHTEEYLKEKAQRNAKKIIIDVIQRLTSPTSVEPREVRVKVPKDIIKGRIVGKDAMNILHLEEKLEIVVVFNDLPNVISVSSYNLMERRIGERTIEKLIRTKKNITPETVDQAIKEAKEDVKEELYKIGEKALKKMGISKLPTNNKELVQTIGRLKFRTSYSQNIMMHSMEVGFIATMLGSEAGLDIETCKVAGFLHDLGKAIDQDPDVQGAHDFLTKELMEKYGFSKEAVHAAWTHHESEKPETPEALIVQAADALSASRPGARQESLEKYLERLNALESAATSFDGVKKTFAISAGRELRVLVDPTEVNDDQTLGLAEKIAEKIESELSYPGKIKVNVIRRTKTTEIAK